MIDQFGLTSFLSTDRRVRGIWITEPLRYLEFLHLNMNARMVLTDSGGLQEETTVLGVPCLTLRFNTKRPITCTQGTNELVGNQKDRILEAVHRVMQGVTKPAHLPEKWDGSAARRIADVLRGSTLCHEAEGSLQARPARRDWAPM